MLGLELLNISVIYNKSYGWLSKPMGETLSMKNLDLSFGNFYALNSFTILSKMGNIGGVETGSM